MVPWNSASGRFAYIWQSKWVGIITIKTEATQIHFLSDVLVAVASLDLKVPTSLRGRRLKGKGKGILSREKRQGHAKGSPPPFYLARGLAPTFPFERLPRSLVTQSLHHVWDIRPRSSGNMLSFLGGVVSPSPNPQPGGPSVAVSLSSPL